MKPFINLIPLERRRMQLVRTRLCQWAAIWSICCLIVAAIGWRKYQCYSQARKAADTAEELYQPFLKLQREKLAMQRERKQLGAKDTILGRLQTEEPMLALVGVVSDSARGCKDRLFVRSFRFERREEPPIAVDKNTPSSKSPTGTDQQVAPVWGRIAVKGESLDNIAIAAFATALRNTGVFRQVELKSSMEKKSSDAKTRSFALQCDI